MKKNQERKGVCCLLFAIGTKLISNLMRIPSGRFWQFWHLKTDKMITLVPFVYLGNLLVFKTT